MSLFLSYKKPGIYFIFPVFIIIAFLHLLYLIFQHTLDFVAHGFLTRLAEMNPHNIGSPANLLHQCGGVLSLCCGGSVLFDFLASHKSPFHAISLYYPLLTISFAAALVALAPSFRKFLPEKRTGAHRSSMRS
jgi:hypothetical protein